MFKTILFCVIVLMAPLSARADAPFDMNRGISGSWYNPAQSGHGFAIEYLNDETLVVYWYMYTPAGDSAFLVGVGTISGNQATIPMDYSDGMIFGEFDPSTLTRPRWGTVTITFDSCTSGTVSYESSFSVNGMAFSSGSLPISRLAYIQDLECDIADLGRDLPKNPIAGFYEGSVNGIEDVVGVILESGQAWFIVPDLGLLKGTLAHENEVATGSLTVKNDVEGVLGTLDIAALFSRRDWISGTYNGLGGGSFSVAYRSAYERDSSQRAYAGRYRRTEIDGYNITVDLDTSGRISGSDTDGCNFSGQISLIDPEFNPVSLQITVSGCSDIAGDYAGVLALVDFEAAGDGRMLYFAADNDQRAILGALIKEI